MGEEDEEGEEAGDGSRSCDGVQATHSFPTFARPCVVRTRTLVERSEGDDAEEVLAR